MGLSNMHAGNGGALSMYRVTTHSVRANSAQARLRERKRENTMIPDIKKKLAILLLRTIAVLGGVVLGPGKRIPVRV